MGFDIGGAINSAADWLSSSAPVRGVVSNPVFTALLLTALVVTIVLSMYMSDIKRHGKKRILRMALLILAAITAVTFIHHNVMTRSLRAELKLKGVHDVFAGVAQSQQMNPPVIAPKVVGAAEDDESDEDTEEEAPAENTSKTAQKEPPKLGKSPGRPDNVRVEVEDLEL
ncbi:MAG: hypothetical protein KGL39_10525 [Patescibacteria group bacterium]|nr:hypothetical protein [Patescibacteria group bacterium]